MTMWSKNMVEPVKAKGLASFGVAMGVALCVLLALLQPSRAVVEYGDLPDLGSSADVAIPPHLERRLSRAVLRQVSRFIYDDPHAGEFLDGMGERLLLAFGENPEEYTFTVMNDTRINAFAAPGGLVGMNIGIFLYAEDYSELAAVMAHEIAHITQKHAARSYGRQGKLQAAAWASLIGGILLSTVSGEAGRAAATIGYAGVIQSQIDYTRDNEKEADRVGMQVLTKAGYSADGMPAFFGRLLEQSKFYSQSVAPEFLRTHPLTENRIAESEQLAEGFPAAASSETDSLDFLLVKAGLQLRQKTPPRQAQIFFREQMRQSEPDSAQYKANRYGMAMALIEAREFSEAEPLVKSMLTEDDQRLEYLVAAGLLHLRRGDMDQGLLYMRKARGAQPEHSWPVLLEAAALLNAERPKEAQRLLRAYGRSRDGLGMAYYEMLARAEEDSGFPAESVLALAEVKYLSGKTKSAIRLLQASQGTPGLSSYQRKRLQARVSELQDEYKLEKKLKIEEKDEERRLSGLGRHHH